MSVDVLLGLQWGDEGKGKIVDFLANQYDFIARYQGGPNAGHTIYLNGDKFVLHTIPSGIFHEKIGNIIGNGVVINPITLLGEIRNLEAAGINVNSRLYIAKKASLILPTHIELDKASEQKRGDAKIGSTLRGISPAYMDRTGRNALKIGEIFTDNFKEKYNTLKDKHLEMISSMGYTADLSKELEWHQSLEELKKYCFIDCEQYVNAQLNNGKKILAEGAQGAMLDIDYGTYPFVTSSNTITGGVCAGLGVAPQKIKEVYGITKAYCTRVGSGPFPTELHDETGEKLRKEGGEFGATTGRPRRCGWIDFVALRYACMLNGVTKLCITKIDVLNNFDKIGYCNQYEISEGVTSEMPSYLTDDIKPKVEFADGWNSNIEIGNQFSSLNENVKKYVSLLEKNIGVMANLVSVGPGRDELFELV
jgi:adenylosuccinate synthase